MIRLDKTHDYFYFFNKKKIQYTSVLFLTNLVVVLINLLSALYVDLLVLRKILEPKYYVKGKKKYIRVWNKMNNTWQNLISCLSHQTHHCCNEDPAVKVSRKLLLSERNSFCWPHMINNHFWKTQFLFENVAQTYCWHFWEYENPSKKS